VWNSPEGSTSSPIALWSVGHSNRPLVVFLELLRQGKIEAVADVRRFPASRSQPQYNADPLREALQGCGIAYCWLPSLGGRRQPSKHGSPTAWRNSGFRGYAEHMETEEFSAGLEELVTLAGGLRTAMLCAEALWWRCHRRLIADALLSLGVPVGHLDDRGAEPHRLIAPARLLRGRLSYAPSRAAAKPGIPRAGS
jgi:uncharacterized protein (DUF488 family)